MAVLKMILPSYVFSVRKLRRKYALSSYPNQILDLVKISFSIFYCFLVLSVCVFSNQVVRCVHSRVGVAPMVERNMKDTAKTKKKVRNAAISVPFGYCFHSLHFGGFSILFLPWSPPEHYSTHDYVFLLSESTLLSRDGATFSWAIHRKDIKIGMSQATFLA